MITGKDIGWGRYETWEGPFYRGSIPYVLPSSPDFKDKVLAVLTATEGGHYDAINMYDTCILSVGLAQWCEKLGLFSSRLLAPCADLDQETLTGFLSKMPVAVEFKHNTAGKWAFFQAGNEVQTGPARRLLFLGDAERGPASTWSDDGRVYAKDVAACMANIWSHEPFRKVQADQTKQHLTSFIPNDRDLLTAFVSYTAPTQLESWSGALRAMYYSFAANLPSVAANSIRVAWKSSSWADADNADRFRVAAQALTFTPNISIYPKRYNAIAPVLMHLFGIDIPITSDALRDWKV